MASATDFESLPVSSHWLPFDFHLLSNYNFPGLLWLNRGTNRATRHHQRHRPRRIRQCLPNLNQRRVHLSLIVVGKPIELKKNTDISVLRNERQMAMGGELKEVFTICPFATVYFRYPPHSVRTFLFVFLTCYN